MTEEWNESDLREKLEEIVKNNDTGELKVIKDAASIDDTTLSELFVSACEYGSFDTVQYLLQQDIDTNHVIYKEEKGWSGIALAAANNHSSIVDLLLKETPVYEEEQLKAFSLLNDVDSVREIIEENDDIDREKLTELVFLSSKNDPWSSETTEYLLTPKIGLDVNQKYNGHGALYWSVFRNHLPLVKELLKNDNVDKGPVAELFLMASQMGHCEIVEHLLCVNGPDIFLTRDRDGCNATEVAILNGHLSVVKVLTEHPKLDHYHNKETMSQLLVLAYNNCQRDIIGFLLTHGNMNVNHAVEIAVKNDQVKLFDILFQQPGINRSTENLSRLLVTACSNKNSGREIVERLLKDSNVDINYTDTDVNHKENKALNNPLLTAVLSGNFSVVELLLEQPDLNKSKFNITVALEMACKSNHPDISKLLLSLHEDLDVKQALYTAIQYNQRNIAEILLKHSNNCVYEILEELEKRMSEIESSYIAKSICMLIAKPPVAEALENSGDKLYRALYDAITNDNLLTLQELLDGKNMLETPESGFFSELLLLASQRGSLAVVDYLLKVKHVNVNYRDVFSRSALLEAATNNHRKTMELLFQCDELDNEEKMRYYAWLDKEYALRQILEKDSCSSDTTRNSQLLLLAVENGSENVVRLLLDQADIDVNFRQYVEYDDPLSHQIDSVVWNGETPINLAIRQNQESIVKLLFEHPDASHDSRLFLTACEAGSYDVAKYFINFDGIDINCKNHQGKSALYLATENDHDSIAHLLLNHRRMDDKEKLRHYVAAGDLPEIRELIDKETRDWDLDEEMMSNFLTSASKNGHYDVVQFFLKSSTSKDLLKYVDFEKALVQAAANNQLPILEALIQQQGMDKNTQTLTKCFYEACALGSVEVVTHLLKVHDFDVTQRNNDGYSALTLAAAGNHTEIIECLLKKEEIEKDHPELSRAFLTACENGSTEVVTHLLSEKHNKMNIKDEDTYVKAVEVAVAGGHKSVLSILLTETVDIKKDNTTIAGLLLTACNYGRNDVVEFLLKSSLEPDINYRDHRGRDAMEIALQSSNYSLMDVLVKSPDINHRSKLVYYVVRNDIEITQQMIKELGEELTTIDLSQLLLTASEHGKSEIVNYLLSNCTVDFYFLDYRRCTAFDVAFRYRHRKIIELLLGHPDFDVFGELRKRYMQIMDNEHANSRYGMRTQQFLADSEAIETAIERNIPISQVFAERYFVGLREEDKDPLRAAVMADNTDKVIELVEERRKLKSGILSEIFILACWKGCLDVALFLLKPRYWIDIRACDEESGKSILHVAVQRKLLFIAEQLGTTSLLDINAGNCLGN